MSSAAPPGSTSSLLASVRALGERLLALAALEGRQAALSLALIAGLALAAAVLVITGWLALVACAVLALVRNDVVGWGWGLAIAALLSLAGAAVLVLVMIRRSRDLTFAATRRQLSLMRGEEGEHD